MIGQLRSVVIDCPDPRALAAFYAELLGVPFVEGDTDDDWVVLGRPARSPAASRLPAGTQPAAAGLAGPGAPQQFHLDVTVDDIEAAEKAALALGARRLPGEGEGFRVYADPAGHPFCLCWD